VASSTIGVLSTCVSLVSTKNPVNRACHPTVLGKLSKGVKAIKKYIVFSVWAEGYALCSFIISIGRKKMSTASSFGTLDLTVMSGVYWR